MLVVQSNIIFYRAVHLLGGLGWVDFDFGCSTLCLVLTGLMGNWLSTWARQWNIVEHQSQLNPAIRADTLIEGMVFLKPTKVTLAHIFISENLMMWLSALPD